MAKVRLAIVVAMSNNGVIGKAGGLPWHLRSDLKRFKEITQFKPIIMGSTTWDSLPKKPLPGRLNIVLSRDPKMEAVGGIICETLFEALDIAREHAADDGADEVCVIGGANVYEQTLAKADRLYVSHVHADVEGDAHFPAIDPAVWRVTSQEAFQKTENDDFDFTLTIYDRVK
ncbi:dihydrofolate reductase [Asticcacaulis sp. AC466]|uniref:dihydrofolate reductase n=1 Tax=Asticcacaulis sp. AC466 TaxID=1282362 RepID=UPI0004CE253B|nr:dihydrofolate reductase [Asticcacaulis sp. AC466]